MRVTAAQCQSAEGVPLSDTCQTPHTPSGGANELQLSGSRPVAVLSRCAFVVHMSNTSHPLWRCQRAPAEQDQPSEQSAEGVPLSDTCQSIHTPSGGANELQLSGASPVPVR